MRALIISNNAISPGASQSQVDPFSRYRLRLRLQFGFQFRHQPVISMDEIDSAEANTYDIVFIQAKVGREDPARLVKILETIHCKKVLLDDYDSSGIDFPHLGACFDHVDLYVKKQTLKNFSDYSIRYFKNKPHAHLIRFHSKPAASNHERAPFNESMKRKLFTGWNVGVRDKFADMFEKTNVQDLFSAKRDIDVCSRVSVGTEVKGDFNYYRIHREQVFTALEPLQNSFNIVATGDGISRPDYLRELKRSKICVSPWGFGEICYRDFEAILCGALLVKPTMQDIATHPNIYRAGVTYIPVAPDFSDLAKVCEYYLKHEDERLRIARKAFKEYKKYFDRNEFVDEVGGILRRLGYIRGYFSMRAIRVFKKK